MLSEIGQCTILLKRCYVGTECRLLAGLLFQEGQDRAEIQNKVSVTSEDPDFILRARSGCV